MEHTILIVEDEKGIRDTVAIFLRNQGYKVLQAENGVEGLELIEKNDIHLAVVDIMMPVMDGITMVMKLREKYDFPVIFLSAKSQDIDKITGLNLGADDYVTKPFEAMELIARVNSHLRRYNQILALKKNTSIPQDNSNSLVVGGLELERLTKEVSVNGRAVRLTPKEFHILELLMSHPGRVYSAEEIYETIWKEDAINTETIMVHVRKLREKIEANPKKPEYLKVVWGIGYKIEKM
ncbi:response regulator transcription factor [Alloiococcus sp. CFN-8]|uniref:response regulator transcription factor n=1 Tax=Alloiococcus sp. CFN-8 TaxID=3416081 RepID=UPI003CE7950F